ncbi:DNA polymerase III subunit epsilon, partial [Morganella morganii]|nr:DNA polymerase III subunit epsilon [Morganella morganii]
DYEFRKLNRGLPPTAEFGNITESLTVARQLFRGERNNLDALCDRYQIDNSKRLLQGALLDAEIRSDVYLAMTGGQTSLAFSAENESSGEGSVQTIQGVT